jgi:hypothetical protein
MPSKTFTRICRSKSLSVAVAVVDGEEFQRPVCVLPHFGYGYCESKFETKKKTCHFRVANPEDE